VVDATALPVKQTSRVCGADGWSGPGDDLAAWFVPSVPALASSSPSGPAGV
jgi:hypothetical protein